jgi:hypothetical protein
MARIRTRKAAGDREGIILLVVISMLVLFSLVGLAFVVYAEGQANTSRIWREGESIQQPDMDPELLLAYFLGQLIYDTNDPTSALRGWGLGTNMYGPPGSTTAFNGTGRLHTTATASTDDFYNIDYTNYPTSGGRNPGQFGSPNPPYTYADFNAPYLAAVQASSGNVLIPSYVRVRPDGTRVSLRPNTNYHTSFPKQASSTTMDVKNRADINGYGGPNDSIWIDIGFPVMTTPDGRKFKPLFAPLIEDMDGKVCINAHGNTLGNIGGGYWSVSHQGWHPGEVNFDRIINGPNHEAGNLFMGNSASPNIQGRYDKTRWANFWGGGGWGGRSNEELKNIYSPGGHFYLSTNLDCWPTGDTNSVSLPSGNFPFPTITPTFSNGWAGRNDDVFNPALWNYFDPRQNCYWLSSPPAEVANNSTFRPYNYESWVRYADEGSPSMTSEVFMLCPQSFATAKTRRLVGWQSFDTVSAGLMPSINNGGALSPYQLAAQPGANAAGGVAPTSPFPSRPPLTFPAPAGSPNSGEFGPTWNGVSLAPTINTILNRIDLNRGYANYYPTLDPNKHTFTNAAGYAPAQQERQQLAQDIFTILRAVTGADNPATSTPGTPQYDALRWLAQLAVNIVDYVNFPQPGQASPSWTSITPDDIMTCFNWNPAQSTSTQNGWVFGTVLPRLVVNEAYVQIANTQQDQMNKPKMAKQYDMNFWVELHNPFANNGVLNANPYVALADNGVARLYNPSGNFAAYRLIIAQTVADGNPAQDNAQQMLKNSNVRGEPINIQCIVDQYTPETSTNPTALNGDDLNQVVPNPNAPTVNPGPQGGNKAFYVLGPGKTPFPGTGQMAAAQNFVTLPVKEQPSVTANNAAAPPPANPINSSMHYTFTPSNPQMTDFSQMNHTIVLQRLACPYMAYQPQPGQPNFNPYVTVDYMMKVPMCSDAITIDANGPNHNGNPASPGSSVGRNQPYAADNTQQVKQTNANPPPGQPQHTFFGPNSQGTNAAGAPFPPFRSDWLVHANRPLISNIELLQVSGFSPAQLTQMFMTQGTDPNTGQPVPQGKFQHRAPWFNSGSMIYRALEFFEGGIRPQWTPPGGRTWGKININTIYDVDTWQALTDQQPLHFFTATAVTNTYNAMIASRGTPGAAAAPRPFLGLAAPFANVGLQFSKGASIDDTILRSDPNAAATQNPQKRLLEPNPDPAQNEIRSQAQDHPYLRLELLNRILTNTTTRSNVFGVWVTVGFFEVVGPGSSGGPPLLGQEINFSTNRHIRHRMFAIVDRTNLTISQTSQGSPGPKPWFVNSMTAVSQPGAATITLPTLGGQYDGTSWNIQQGSTLVVDAGPNQEVVTVTGVNAVQL